MKTVFKLEIIMKFVFAICVMVLSLNSAQAKQLDYSSDQTTIDSSFNIEAQEFDYYLKNLKTDQVIFLSKNEFGPELEIWPGQIHVVIWDTVSQFHLYQHLVVIRNNSPPFSV